MTHRITQLELFNQHRPLLFSIAYRMLGSVVDAEDMVQETFLRWHQVAEETVQSAKAYLSSIITRLCIDHLRSARKKREQYVGSWLPEPILTQQSKKPPSFSQIVEINGQPSIINYIDNQLQSVMTFDFANNQIQSVFIVVNPDKLKLLGADMVTDLPEALPDLD